ARGHRPDPQADGDESQEDRGHDDREENQRENERYGNRGILVHVASPLVILRPTRTTWRYPSLRTTSTAVPWRRYSPSVTTSTRSSPNPAVLEGRKSVRAMPRRPTRSGRDGAVTKPSRR